MMNLTEYLQSNFSLSTVELEMVETTFEKEVLSKGEYFLKEGQYSRRIGFVESGSVIYFQNDVDGNEKVCDFGFPGDWLAHIKSMTTGTPTDMNIRALETTAIRWITGEGIKKWVQKFPSAAVGLEFRF